MGCPWSQIRVHENRGLNPIPDLASDCRMFMLSRATSLLNGSGVIYAFSTQMCFDHIQMRFAKTIERCSISAIEAHPVLQECADAPLRSSCHRPRRNSESLAPIGTRAHKQSKNNTLTSISIRQLVWTAPDIQDEEYPSLCEIIQCLSLTPPRSNDRLSPFLSIAAI